ncbi:pyridoxamine 5'-phosphate oxidase family protein [Kribbella sp. NPDC051770]|uniref:pyridoxamine 5'-phosphate oxidase family protein n=1 Tax=Kribbella sp. NPDC051770 TaxID=3155413 RepID=UPI00343CB97D
MNPEDIARRIVAANNYLTLATADADGRPWASPVCYTPSGTDFYWVSRPDSRHSQNLAVRPEAGIVIFDSQVALFRAEAVYLNVRAAEVSLDELESCAAIYSARFPEIDEFGPDRLQEPAPLRLYRASVVEASVLLDDDGPDFRVPVTL